MDLIEKVNNLGNIASESDFSLWVLFLEADIVVKIVMLILILASIWSWAIIFDKIFGLRAVTNKSRKFEEKFWSGSSLDDLYNSVGLRPSDPMSSIFVVAMRELKRSSEKGFDKTPKNIVIIEQRIDRVMRVSLEREMDSLQKNMTFLASTGSVSPFLGLFGTVWGIMNTFSAIGISSDTSLATVAPGIAEALFATALGLVAAIPAVIAYNSISSDMNRYAMRLENFVGEFGTIISRQFDES
ncbi:MAG: protein TolQ [Alphaproteobacteria bacterium TMED87]|nr:protein TolQ [Rhodospirillaceae bacterium]OUV08973.1 MAG: protein TolQ [Alphaproteobacteria bacterium TMED87]|tara:strand:- start:75 stop:800 length:726 start_codon:yes stop_codon:yes gene_type:complete